MPTTIRELYWRFRRFERRIRHDPQRELPDLALQYAWFLSGIPAADIGYGAGPLTWLRTRRHARLRRSLHITILEDDVTGLGFGHLTAHWINERSTICTASVNSRIEEADIVWVNAQDPLSADLQQHFLSLLARARPDAKILNHPLHYNAYHEPGIFNRLAAAGVRVPRSSLGPQDLGKTNVVYKQLGRHAAPKEARPYSGELAGHAVYEFIDSRDADRLYRRYRAHYLSGAVRPSKLMRCTHWNVCLKNQPEITPTFVLTADEIDQLRRIAAVTQLDFFAVDFVRRRGDDAAYFVDINIYPTIEAITQCREQGYRGRWHTFDTRMRLGLPEPGGRPFVAVFDDAMRRVVENYKGFTARI